MKKSLEKRYPGICEDINDVMEDGENCINKWNKKGLGDNKERIKSFQVSRHITALNDSTKVVFSFSFSHSSLVALLINYELVTTYQNQLMVYWKS